MSTALAILSRRRGLYCTPPLACIGCWAGEINLSKIIDLELTAVLET
jgi:hypothetical protein